ncbi:hypothetical protein BDR22DRAFT_843092 [Usnea florida]
MSCTINSTFIESGGREVTRPVLSALQRTNAQPDLSITRASRPSNTTLNATAPNPIQRTKSYHVPNSPITLNFFAYAAPPSLGPPVTFQVLLTALNSIYHSTLENHGDGLIRREQASWSYSGAAVFIENHGVDRTGQLTWGMLADTMLGVGSFFERGGYSTGEWSIDVEGLGDIGSGYVVARVGGEVEGTLAGSAVESV